MPVCCGRHPINCGDLLLGPAAERSLTGGEVVRHHDVAAALKPRSAREAKDGQLSRGPEDMKL